MADDGNKEQLAKREMNEDEEMDLHDDNLMKWFYYMDPTESRGDVERSTIWQNIKPPWKNKGASSHGRRLKNWAIMIMA